MEDTFPEHYRVVYERDLALDSQQTEALIAPFVDVMYDYAEKGETFSKGNIGKSSMKEVDDKYGPLPDGQIDKRRRTGHFSVWHDGKNFGSTIDEARQVSDPTNEQSMAQKAGLARRQDAKCIEAMLGSAYSGKNGATVTALPAAQSIALADHTYDAGAGDASMTLGKLINARTKLKSQYVRGQYHIALPASQTSQLLAFESKMSNIDTATVRALVAGEVDTFMGFKFHEYEDTADDANGDDQVVCWVEKAICFRQRILEKPLIWKRRDVMPHWYGYFMVDHAALRREDLGVLNILCKKP